LAGLRSSVRCYQQLASLNGGYSRTQNSVRLFIVPGMRNCGGGVAPNSFDTLQALHNRVKKGVGPGRSRCDDHQSSDYAALQVS
jgi:Tannase and feruloyl esterase